MSRVTIKVISMVSIILIAFLLLMPTMVNAESVCKVVSIAKGEDITVTITDNSENVKRTIDKVPLFDQGNYRGVPYGEYGTVSSHGCGIVSLAMVVTYLKDQFHSPADLAIQFADYNTENGSYWSLFTDSAKVLGIDPPELTLSWEKAKEALENGKVVISLHGGGYFTESGHFIVLTGVNEDGKVMVNDPGGSNWNKNEMMIDGFTNGFEDYHITFGGRRYWIYSKEDSV